MAPRVASKMMTALLAVLLSCATADDSLDSHDMATSWFSQQDGSWTGRLGLRFKDDCQETGGLQGLFVWIWSWATRRGQQRWAAAMWMADADGIAERERWRSGAGGDGGGGVSGGDGGGGEGVRRQRWQRRSV